ncbi:hypothetical protein [Kitasatospora sp. NPDC098663]|uniref:hypothetical protein n=1 Tax=Kitasatospora sp. NPDC098663 TaxID=3364096 RepID=UPI0038174630
MKGTAMQNVISSNDGVDVAQEYADQVRDLLDRGRADTLRRTLWTDGNDADLRRIEIVCYPRPGTGETALALVYWDDDSYEVQEAADQPEAEQHYLETVRVTTGFDVDDNGREISAAETDVPGVPGYDGAFHSAYRIDRGTLDTELRSEVIEHDVKARSAQTLANALLAAHLACPGVEPAAWRSQVWTGTSPEEAGAAMRSGRHAFAVAQQV